MENRNNVIKILKSSDTLAITNLITSRNTAIAHGMRMINIKGSGLVDVKKRRLINKQFMNCLIEVESDLPSALRFELDNTRVESFWGNCMAFPANLHRGDRFLCVDHHIFKVF